MELLHSGGKGFGAVSAAGANWPRSGDAVQDPGDRDPEGREGLSGRPGGRLGLPLGEGVCGSAGGVGGGAGGGGSGVGASATSSVTNSGNPASRVAKSCGSAA